MKSAEIKPKPCAVCPKEFRPFNTTDKVCSIGCALTYAAQKREKKFKQETRRLKREFRSKDKSFWKKKARAMCHKYIRTRDQKDPCISCGCVSAGQFDAGHFKTRGAKTELQFHEWNIHKQCSVCNNFRSAHDTDYRDNLIKKIGLKGVEFLEGPHQHYKWTIDDYKDVFEYYKLKLEEL